MPLLPAELAQEARNVILTHWTVGWVQIGISDITFGHVIQLSFSCHKKKQLFSPTQPPFLPVCFTVIWVVRLQIKYCCILVWQSMAFSVWENFCKIQSKNSPQLQTNSTENNYWDILHRTGVINKTNWTHFTLYTSENNLMNFLLYRKSRWISHYWSVPNNVCTYTILTV